ncbi:response regulator transcription factor [Pedobacter gandavensis]|uniref:LytR/AlgR family response regulator transcription factor n=1 Tax=Pedobacter gandavensis TaxID=2679963 RepID=UPI00247A37BA|nr:response regulator transcription factor [Pedobacter gandavensis]WGQ10439.1 response regulator transcription factor [Pedobacter gandavensis]
MKTKINCIIIDEDQFSINLLKDHIAGIPQLNLQQVYTNPIIALAELSNLPTIDLLFLNIDIPTLVLLRLTESLKHKIKKNIYTSTFQNHAIEYQGEDCLLKPIAQLHFEAMISKTISSIKKNNTDYLNDGSYYLPSGAGGQRVRVHKNEILYIQGAQNYVAIHTANKTYTIYNTLKGMEIWFENQPTFFRVHKSFIVNSDHVLEINGNCLLLTKGSIAMSNSYKNRFCQYIRHKTICSKRLST